MKSWSGLLLFLFSVFSYVTSIDITDESIQKITNEIWDSDLNKFDSKDIVVNPRGEKLFEFVNEAKLVGTYKLLMSLFDNYAAKIGVQESTDRIETNEEKAFLDAIVESIPMKLAHDWLVQKKLASKDKELFKKEIRQYWLMFYSRSGKVLDSSGFEHVFLGELKNNDVTGFHNWLFAYLQEKQGTFSYISLDRDCKNNVLAFKFTWYDALKPKSSVIIGVSPETELAIYTICFLTRPDKTCKIQIVGKNYNVATFRMAGTTAVSTSYIQC